jgi:hypothetical protein
MILRTSVHANGAFTSPILLLVSISVATVNSVVVQQMAVQQISVSGRAVHILDIDIFNQVLPTFTSQSRL